MKRTTATSKARAGAPGILFGISEDLLVPMAIPPVQFHALWSGSGTRSPERRLALAVLGVALNDLASHRFAKLRRQQRLYSDAYAWVAADDREWPFAFANLCEVAGLEATEIRRRALEPTATAPRSAGAIDLRLERALQRAA